MRGDRFNRTIGKSMVADKEIFCVRDKTRIQSIACTPKHPVTRCMRWQLERTKQHLIGDFIRKSKKTLHISYLKSMKGYLRFDFSSKCGCGLLLLFSFFPIMHNPSSYSLLLLIFSIRASEEEDTGHHHVMTCSASNIIDTSRS